MIFIDLRMIKMFWKTLSTLLVLSACTPFVSQHGYQIDHDKLKEIKIGVDTQDTVRAKLGSPSFTSFFPDEKKQNSSSKWIYAYKKTVSKAFLPEETKDFQMCIIEFSGQGKVSLIQEQNKEYEYEVNKNETSSSGYETGVLRDVFSGLARLNSQKKAPSK